MTSPPWAKRLPAPKRSKWAHAGAGFLTATDAGCRVKMRQTENQRIFPPTANAFQALFKNEFGTLREAYGIGVILRGRSYSV
jgi:hypothetical protein